jgi:hypothetical protein
LLESVTRGSILGGGQAEILIAIVGNDHNALRVDALCGFVASPSGRPFEAS